jgi:hypothetical protein
MIIKSKNAGNVFIYQIVVVVVVENNLIPLLSIFEIKVYHYKLNIILFCIII